MCTNNQFVYIYRCMVHICHLRYINMANNISHFSAFWKGWSSGSLEEVEEVFLCISGFSYCSWWITGGSDWGVGRGQGRSQYWACSPEDPEHEQMARAGGRSFLSAALHPGFFYHPGGDCPLPSVSVTGRLPLYLQFKVGLVRLPLSDRANYLYQASCLHNLSSSWVNGAVWLCLHYTKGQAPSRQGKKAQEQPECRQIVPPVVETPSFTELICNF